MRLTALIVLLAAAAASGPSAAPHGTATSPCNKPGCIDPDAALDAPPGAILSYQRCREGRLEERRYRRVADGWDLQSYTETVVTRCPETERQ